MTDRHDVAARVALLKVIGDLIGGASKVARAAIVDGWRPKDRAAAVVGGREIGAVTLSSGRASARVADEAAFVAWVEKTHPEQMETVTQTRPNPEFVDRLTAAARKLGVAVDAETGEEVPGIAVEVGAPYPTVRLSGDAVEVVAEAWRRGELVELLAAVLPAIEPGESGGSQ